MNYPIPRPKKLVYTGGTIPATFDFINPYPVFAPAVRAFREYVGRIKAPLENSSAKIELVYEEGLDDGYRISIHDHAVIIASTNIGMNHALATLLQLTRNTDGGMLFPQCEITDRPDSSWRGVMLDLARCFHETEYLYAVADLCWFYKINRFQLHLTDDQAIRFHISSLSRAVSDEHYTREQLTALLEYCHDRGITIVPEIDVPGHFSAFNRAYPELFAPIYEAGDTPAAAFHHSNSEIMRTDEQAFAAISQVFNEVADVFYNSPWIHIGGDEAKLEQWERCKASMEYCSRNGITELHALYAHCVARVSQIILDLGRVPVVWEGFSEKYNHMIPKETLVFSWESYYQTAPSLLKDGFKIINSSWQPLYIVNPERMWPAETILDWEKNRWENWWERSLAYNAPIVTDKTPSILGGQLCVWGDKMQPSNGYAPRPSMLRDEFSNLRERLPALAEKNWTSYRALDKEKFLADLHHLDSILEKLINA